MIFGVRSNCFATTTALSSLIFLFFFDRDTPAFGLYMILYDFFVHKFEEQKSLGLFWAGGLAGKDTYVRNGLAGKDTGT